MTFTEGNILGNVRGLNIFFFYVFGLNIHRRGPPKDETSLSKIERNRAVNIAGISEMRLRRTPPEQGVFLVLASTARRDVGNSLENADLSRVS